jgi:hypothetical protein
MLRINARDLLKYSTEQLWEGLTGEFVLVFDDGEIVSNYKEVLYSSYVWDFHREYLNTPVLVKHHIQHHVGSKRLGASTHLNLINSVLWSVFDTYTHSVNDKTKLLDDLAHKAYQIANIMYNDLTYRLEEYVTSLDITDFISVTKHPEIEHSINTMPATQEGIDHVYNTIKRLFKEDPEFKKNPLVKVINSGLANMGQALQCVGPRGFLTDIDSNLFRNPIKRGFTQGIRSAHDMMIETRSAAKSLIFSTDPLQQSEYFSRRQQFICQNVRHIHSGDCGSKEYLEWHVRDARYEGTTKVSDCDLITLAGKYYLDEQTKSLKVLTVDDTHLIGKVVKLRSPIAGCAHPDPYGICEVCYGETALGIPKNSNLGHITCVSMTAVVGQNILSTKHFDGSSVVEGIVLKPEEKKYLSSTVNGSCYYLADSLKNKNVQLVMSSRNASGLTDILMVNSIEKLSLARISEFEDIGIIITTPKETEIRTLSVNVNGRLSSLTYDLLKYIKEKGWNVTSDDNYVVDMSGWDYSKPILVLPMRHFNMSDHQGEIATMLEATVEDLEKRSSVINPCSMIVDFHDLVNRRLSINLAILEVIFYSSMGVDPMNDDYALPKVGTQSGIGVMRQLLNKRSLAATMGYQGHRDVLVNPTSYMLKERLNHVYDGVILPDLLLK